MMFETGLQNAMMLSNLFRTRIPRPLDLAPGFTIHVFVNPSLFDAGQIVYKNFVKGQVSISLYSSKMQFSFGKKRCVYEELRCMKNFVNIKAFLYMKNFVHMKNSVSMKSCD
jgi:hypothetical protein